MNNKIDTPCPHCGRESLEIVGDFICDVNCTWLDCQYRVANIGSWEEAAAFANKRVDKEKTKLIHLLRDAFHIIDTSEITLDGKTVSERSLKIFKGKYDELFGEKGRYKPRKQ